MLTFSPPKFISQLVKKNKKFSYKDYKVPSPTEIRESIQKMTSCPKCKFLIFDNYWTSEIETIEVRLCPTCGYKL